MLIIPVLILIVLVALILFGIAMFAVIRAIWKAHISHKSTRKFNGCGVL